MNADSEEPGSADAWLGRRGLMVIATLAIILPIPVYWICSPDGVKARRRVIVEEQYSVEEASGFSGGREGSGISESEGEASSEEGMVDVDTLGRELLLKVLEGNEDETKETVTPRFLEDLEYNRAVIQSADLARLQLERQGRYWVQGRTPYQLPPRAGGLPGKAGMAQFRMVFMDGRWKLHDLNLQ